MKLQRMLVLLVAFALLPVVCIAREHQPEISCSLGVYSQQGDLVEVTCRGQSLSLTVVRSDWSRESGQVSIQTDKYGDADCSLFISRDGSLAAVVTQVPLKNPVDVYVWDLTTARWLSSFKLAPRPGLEGNIAVLGFWKGGTDLAVQSTLMVDYWHSQEALAILNTSGKILAGPRAGNYPVVDVERGRVWTASGGMGSCSETAEGSYSECSCEGKKVPCSRLKTPCLYSVATFRGMLLRPPVAGKSKVSCAAFGGGSVFVGFPGPNLVAATEGLESYRDEHDAEFEPGGPYATQSLKNRYGTVVSVCHIATNKCKRIVIPAPRKSFFNVWVDDGPHELQVSPDGRFFAVEARITRWGLFNIEQSVRNKLYVFQTDPFRQIATLDRKGMFSCADLYAFAVGNSGGAARIATNWCGKWSFQTLSR